MATYIGLLSYTDKGIQAAKDIPKRVEAARELARSSGAQITSFHLTMGRFDGVVVAEAPDDAAMARLVLTVAGQGNVRTETLRAFTESEVREIVANL